MCQDFFSKAAENVRMFCEHVTSHSQGKSGLLNCSIQRRLKGTCELTVSRPASKMFSVSSRMICGSVFVPHQDTTH